MGIELKLDVDEDSNGPVIPDSEVTNAIEALKVGKAIGPDGIPAEFWKVLGVKGTKDVCEGHMAIRFHKMIPLQEKMNAVECTDHRTMLC